jgi:SpoVK/Ycf46/Vps4 family AAA+-type ATPase
VLYVCITSVVQASGGYSGSDIRLVCKEAAMSAMREAFSVLETCQNGNILHIFQIIKLMVFEGVTPCGLVDGCQSCTQHIYLWCI